MTHQLEELLLQVEVSQWLEVELVVFVHHQLEEELVSLHHQLEELLWDNYH